MKGSFVAAAALLLAAAACARGTITLDEGPCPCAAGYVCCEPARRCVLPPACPAGVRVERIEPAAGPTEGGTLVAIEGEGFPAEVAVSVGGVWCAGVARESDRKLSCTTAPARSGGAADVVVSGGTGSGVLRGGFRYVEPPFSEVALEVGLPEWRGVGGAAFDADGDGLLELFLTNIDDPGPVLLQNEGALSFEASVAAPDGVSRSYAAVPSDFDGDGRTDVLVLAAGGASPALRPVLMLANRRGGFDTQEQAGLRTAPEISCFTATDYDGDGDPDLLGCSEGSGAAVTLRLGLNEGGRLVEAAAPGTAGAFNGTGECFTLTTGDLDLDGDEDLVTCGSHVRVFVRGGGRLEDSTVRLGLSDAPFPLRASGVRCTAVDAVDFDSDGDLDVVFGLNTDVSEGEGSRNRHGLVLLENRLHPDGALTFRPAPPLDLDRGALLERCIHAGHTDPAASLIAVTGGRAAWLDADHDGDLDLLAPRPFGPCWETPLFYESRFAGGGAGFVPRFLDAFGVLSAVQGVFSADLDGDGDLDAVQQFWGTGRRALFRNNLVENTGSAAGPKGDPVFVRVVVRGHAVLGETVELDLDGPAGAPDFARGPGRLLVRALGLGGFRSVSGFDAHFGVPRPRGLLHARVRLAGGRSIVAPIPEGVTRVVIDAN